jgi:protein SCO1/2
MGGAWLLTAMLLGSPGRPLDGPAWVDEGGRTVGAATWKGHPAILTTFYRSCPMACPRTLAKLRRVEQVFLRRGVPLEILLITLDPGADTPDRLRAFKARQGLSSSWHFLRGPRAQVVAFCREIFGWIPLYDGDHVDHRQSFVLLDRGGNTVRTLSGLGFQEEDLPGSL